MNVALEPQLKKLLGRAGGQTGQDQTRRLIALTREGVPARSAFDLARRYNLSEPQLAELLGVSTRTLARMKSADARLNPVQSDRLLRLARIVAHAETVFDTFEVALDWLKNPNRALGGDVPLSLLDTDAGAVQVEEILTRIDYGIYS